MKIYGYKIQPIFQGFADAMAFTFLILTIAWRIGLPVAWEHPMYAAGYGFSAYTSKRLYDLFDEVKSSK